MTQTVRTDVQKTWLIRVLFLGVVFGFWELAAIQGWISVLFTGQPSKIFIAMYRDLRSLDFYYDLAITLNETIIGFVIGSVAGLLTAFIFARYRLLERALHPILMAINSTPRIALAPLFILWFGLGQTSKIALSVSLVFFVMLSNALVGLTNTDREFMLLAKSLGATERQRLVRFVLPSAVPMIGAALELGLVFSFLAVVSGEFIGATRGLGVRLSYAAATFEMSEFFAALFILAIVTTLFSLALRAGQRRVIRWHYIEMRGLGHTATSTL